MIDWTQVEHAEVRNFVKIPNALRNAITKFCELRTQQLRAESSSALLAVPRNLDHAANTAVEAEVYAKFMRRLESEVNSFERQSIALLNSAEPTREEE